MEWSNLVFHPGNEELERFVELGILAATLEIPLHFHVEGMRGTGKTTLIRAARGRLPAIERICGCLYNCRPESPHCPDHSRAAGAMAREQVPMPFLEISHSAKVSTVAGSIDLGRLLSPDNPGAAVLPGTLPRSHRGIVFVDEINRLADTSPALVDVLLDAMGTKPGRVQIEETGLPVVEIPLNAGVWAASNPDEEPGPLQEIRKQLADRFDFAVRIDRPGRPEVVRSIMAAAQKAGTAGGPGFSSPAGIERIRLDGRVEDFLSEIYVRFSLESIRGIQAARLGALLHAARQGREVAGFADLAAVLPAALRHRLEPPRMPEVLSALKNAGEEAKREQAARPAARDTDLRREGEGKSYPALWRGLFRRMAGKNAVRNGRQSEAQSTHNQLRPGREYEEEKKKTAPAAIPAGKDGPDR
jgi:magnesium chelatase subunit I